MQNIKTKFSILLILFSVFLTGCVSSYNGNAYVLEESIKTDKAEAVKKDETNSLSYIINDNMPFFSKEEKENTEFFEYYSELDSLGRCGYCMANICKEGMPTEPRGNIGHIKPSGWKQAKYPGIIDSDPPYLYNRCHLIGFQLTGENDNEKNLITGTRYFNTEGMLPYENIVANYVRQTNNHVLYRITPDFHDKDLIAEGVYMEAYSVEDNGKGVCFCVYVKNIQPGIKINYLTGENHEEN